MAHGVQGAQHAPERAHTHTHTVHTHAYTAHSTHTAHNIHAHTCPHTAHKDAGQVYIGQYNIIPKSGFSHFKFLFYVISTF